MVCVLIAGCRPKPAPESSHDISTSKPAKITAVTTDATKRTLLVRYEVAGTAYEERIMFTQNVADFRYCQWLGDYGIAVVARTEIGDTSEYFYSTCYLKGGSKDHRAAKIPAPTNTSPVLGIGNTVGDSVVITAFEHSRSPPSGSISGWTYIDNCPKRTDSGLATGKSTLIPALSAPE